MSFQGVQQVYYGKTLPARSVGIAEVSVPPLSPAQLTDINNTIYDQGALSVWKYTSSLSGAADFTAGALGLAVEISAVDSYYVGNQFFEITNVTAADNETLMFYAHPLPIGATHVQILNLSGAIVDTVTLISSNILYHSLDGEPYRVQYINANGYLILEVLQYSNVISQSTLVAEPGMYTLTGSILTLPDTTPYWIRFTQNNGYQVMPMYTYLSNTPWYARVRYGLTPPPVDWALQNFVPITPYISASYVAGTILDIHMIQFERKNIYKDPAHLPDILIFDSNNNFKYALDGYVSVSGGEEDLPYLKGYIYPWQAGKISSMDWNYARVDVAVELDPTDIVWGFYTYAEPDVIYTGFDCNPFTNPTAKNTILELYTEFPGNNPTQNIYHQLLDSSGDPILGQTNDPNPGTGTTTIFADVSVGSSVSQADFSFKDIRVRGGGLAPQYFTTVPQSVNFWDIGYCFPAGTKLTTPKGIINIESVKQGDLVYTHTGKSKSINKVMMHTIDTLTSIKVSGSYKAINCSPEHPFYVVKRNGKSKKDTIRNIPNLEWLSASEMEKGDYLYIPKRVNLKNSEFTNEQLYVMGWWIAEGHIQNNQLGFTIGIKEAENTGCLKVIKDTLHAWDPPEGRILSTRSKYGKPFNKKCNLKGLRVYKREDRGCYHVTFTSPKLVNLFMSLFGTGAHNKHIEKELFDCKNLLPLVCGWLDGDRHQRTSQDRAGLSFIGASVSEELVWQIRQILIDNDIYSTIQYEPKKVVYKVCISQNYTNCLTFSKKANKTIYDEKSSALGFRYLDGFLIPIKEIETSKLNNPVEVFNIEVEEDNSYLVDGIAVHNCDGKGYPFAGALVVYLPYDILTTLSRAEIQGRINSVIPVGCIAVLRYIDENGNEWV
jgi:hypothetical protein